MPSLMKYINIISRCGAIWRADRLKAFGLGDSQHSYILALCRNPGISQDSLSKKLFINKSNVTRNLAALEKAGYVERRQSDEDRRVTLVYPTGKAYSVLPEVRSTLHGWREYLTEGLSEEEKAMLGEILPKLAERAAAYAELSEEALGDGEAPEGEADGK